MENKQVQKGDTVVYGNNGICRVDDIQNMTFPGERKPRPYFVLRPINSKNSVLFVPRDNEALCSKMRAVLSKHQIDTMLSHLSQEEAPWIADKNERFERFHQTLRQGIHEELLAMIRCIHLHKQELAGMNRKLTSSDDSILQTAEKLVREEFAYALEIPQEEVGGYIRSRLVEPPKSS